mmetsp:Transcript_4130/g.7030  ORF Transcript_4130/g.7030 Transcript_4130/m.7030 type:complete len:355 (+) Transcript_4130:266-1330(+)
MPAAAEAAPFGSIVPRKRRTTHNPTTSAMTTDNFADLPSPTARMDSLAAVAEQLDSPNTLARKAQEERVITYEAVTNSTNGDGSPGSNGNGVLPPSFSPSPPLSPYATKAAAAAAAAAAAKAQTKTTTWISGESTRASENGAHGTAAASGTLRETVSPTEGDDGIAQGERRSSRRRVSNIRFEPYLTSTKGNIPLEEPPKSSKKSRGLPPEGHKTSSNKRRNSPPVPSSSSKAVDDERKIERTLEHLQLQVGKNHPEVGKALLQVARQCFARKDFEEAEKYLKRSWNVFKCHIDRVPHIQEVFNSFLSLFEDYQCTIEGVNSVKKEMDVLSPRTPVEPDQLEWNKGPGGLGLAC